MKLTIAKIANRSLTAGREGRVIPVPPGGVPVRTAEDRTRLEAAARRRNDKRKYPVLHEA